MDHKFVKIQRMSERMPIRESCRYEVTEKLDGGNFSFYVGEGGDLICRSRNRELIEDTGNFTRCVEYVKSAHAEFPFIQGYVYFGECMTKHTIAYGQTHPFVGFAVMVLDTQEYTPEWEYHYRSRSVPFIESNYMDGCDVLAYVDANLNNKSMYGDVGATQEGLVIKCYETQEFIKFVRDQFKEDNREAFKGKMVPEDDTGKIVLRFCTHGRIEKHTYKLRDELDMPISIEMMKWLPKIICDDIIAEEFMTIYNKYTTMNFKQFRKLIAKECVWFFNSRKVVV